MTRNLKVLGLALVAALALSAVVASAASAGKLTSDGAVTLTGTQTGEASANALTAFGGETRCPNATYTGHKALSLTDTAGEPNAEPPVPPKSHELISSGATSITITPHYGSCTALGFPATIDMNGCDYTFEIGTGVNHVYPIGAKVVCPAGKHITLTIFGSHTKHTANEPFCHITITEKAEAYTGLSATDTTNGTGDITGTVTGIKADKASPTGSILCPTESTESASLKQDVTVTGKNVGGGATTISLSN